VNHPAAALLLALLVADSTKVEVAEGQLPHPIVEDTILRPSQQFDVTRFDSATAVLLRAVFDSAAVRGLPTAPLVNRALEGAARRIVGSKIVAVVRAHATAMEDSRRILGPRVSSAEIDACATAMRAGVDGGTMALLRQARASTSVLNPCVVLTDLIQRGVPFAMANNAVVSVSRLQRSDDLLDAMRGAVAKGSTRGGPTMAVEALQRYLRETVPANSRAP
jgi:hypothetical protein